MRMVRGTIVLTSCSEIAPGAAHACPPDTLRSGMRRYLVAYTFDTTLGMALAIGLHRLAVRLCMRRAEAMPDGKETWHRAVAECGEYGAPCSANSSQNRALD